jgi:hypothetical protein
MSSLRSASKRSWGVRYRKTLQFLAGAMGALLLCVPLFSQGSYGRILGTVTDQTGGVVSGATVTIIDRDRGVARTLTTDDAGEYNAPTLIPGTYTVRVEAKGFNTFQRQNILVQVGNEVRVDATVQPGTEAQTITVTEAAPLVETTNATLGGALDNATINDMPLNGRNYQNLISLRPGIVIQPGGSPWTQSTNDLRPDETVWMLDGVINVSFYDARQVTNSPSSITDAATILPIDAIQEFNTQENPKAEYGWKPGAIVDVGIRSGTNTLHGTAYAFGRDVAFDARNTFNPGLDPSGVCDPNPSTPTVCNKLPTQLEQFGATVGGPIKKDKLFYFAGYEGLRDFIGNAFVASIPENAAQTPGNPANSMEDAIAALQTAGVPRSIVSENLLGCTGDSPLNTSRTLIPVQCTGGLYAGAQANTTNYFSTFPNTNTSDNGIAKIDYAINDKNKIAGMFWTGNYRANGQDHPVVNSLFTSGFTGTSWSTVESWTYTPTSNLVNQVLVGYDRVSTGFTVSDANIIPNGTGGLCTAAGCGGSGYPLNTGVTKGGGLPYILIGSFGNPGGGGGLGNPNNTRPALWGPNPYLDFQDSISYLKGHHSLKFGVEFTHIEADQITEDFRGVLIDFAGGQTPGLTDCAGASCPLEDFFAGNPAFGSNNVGNGNREMVWWHYAGFVQDDWRIKPRLMLNLGLRYEYASPIREVNNLYGNFDPNSETGIVQQGQPGVGSSLWGPDPKNFSPRFGFAWDVTGKGTTVVRGGASVLYSTIVARPFMDNGPPDGSLGNVAEDPSAAELISATPLSGFTACAPPFPTGQFCHAGSGTINLGQPTYFPPSLNWDPTITGNSAPAFPTTGLTCSSSSQCGLMAVDPHLKTPYVVNYSLGVQHSFGSNLSLDVSYVGNHGADLLGLTDVNQCEPTSTGVCTRPYAAKFPYLTYINTVSNFAISYYNSLQATLTKRLSHGLELTAGYTYGHGLDDGSLNFAGQLPQNSSDPAAEYASSDFDIRHRLTVTASYEIPGRKGYAQLLEGWKLNTIVTVQSSQPWLVFDGADDFSTGGSHLGDLADRWDFFGNPSDFGSSASSIMHCTGPVDGGCSQTSGITTLLTCGASAGTGPGGSCDAATSTALWSKCMAVAPTNSPLATAGCYVSGNSVMVPPTLGTYGTMGRNIFRDSGFRDVDFSVFKNFKFGERIGAEFRAEIFNLFNHPIIANPYGASNTSYLGVDPSKPSTFGCGCATPDVAAGNPLIGSGSSRVMQLGLKLMF